jgi:hypothetical protein
MLRKSMTHVGTVVDIIYIERFREPLLNIRAPKEARSLILYSRQFVSGARIRLSRSDSAPGPP